MDWIEERPEPEAWLMQHSFLVTLEKPRIYRYNRTVSANNEAQAFELAKQQALDMGVAEADDFYDESIIVVDIAKLEEVLDGGA